ncbi:MAG: ATP-binding protein, partial [Candidatus Altiarchaeota archaeon]|nr:ATP-binding protein [Candidatus Altiarchaeota archaeon]
MRFIGTIHGKVNPTSFDILLAVADVEKGSFVKINHEIYGWVLARIENLNRYLEKGEEVILANARTVGYKLGNHILIPKTPFKPQEKVYSADRELIADIIGLEKTKTDNLYLGLLEGHDIPVYLDTDKCIGKHMSVLAKTGAGKSYTVGVILEELLKGRFPIVIIDPHGEYSSLKHESEDYDSMLPYGTKPRGYDSQIKEYAANIIANPEARKFSIRPKFTLEELVEILPMRLTDKQKSIVYEVLRRVEHQDYTIQDLINAVRMEENKTKWKIIRALESLRNSGIFDGKPLSEKDLVKGGQATIINLKGAETRIQELIVSKVSKDLFNAIKIGDIPPFFYLIEEAHNFCPERGFGDTLSSQILRDIASEGRKFGLHLCVVSQRPARIDKNVLSQCNTQIILKVTNPNDLRALGQSIEGFTPGMENDIKQLSVGQALVVGECVEQPITINIRARETRHGGPRDGEAKPRPETKPSIVDKIKPVFIREDEPPRPITQEKP